MGKSFIAQSKISWSPSGGREATVEEIQVGCFQRIADATELMAKNYIQMERELKNYKEANLFSSHKINSLTATNKALRGHITRLKNKAIAIVR